MLETIITAPEAVAVILAGLPAALAGNAVYIRRVARQARAGAR